MDNGKLNIVGIKELQGLPEFWPLLFEDQFDRDEDGVSGTAQFVSGGGKPLLGKWGERLAAARFEDFAKIAGAAHNIKIDNDMDRIKAVFERLSPAPTSPFSSPQDLATFKAEGCAACHVTQTYAFEGKTLMPLSDFLLHDLGDGKGERRTKPLWGCDALCLQFRHE
ncbi:MAG: hypothetical protein AAFO61_08660 [Pseudomonadota bacterium]